ncbi:ABC transporter ATP-binding protein [Paenibacillus chartarius]|uniref:ABC transporter ATP-binding protein n=1 Tax=Paenibacillus chartarius TaxID=747481 RepID=A0ABV6DFN3_9BACL
MKPILETRDLTVAFGGHTAVNGVELTVPPCHFKSIIGPNGAGKTTLFNLLSGQLKPTRGEVWFKGENITNMPPHLRTRRGLGRSFQITNVFPNLTVLENVRLAVQSRESIRFHLFRHFSAYRRLLDEAYALLDTVLLADKADSPACLLAHGEKRKLEIAMLLALDAELLLLDEPTAGISIEEVPAILEVIQAIRDRRDRSIVLIEHKMEMVLHLSDSLTVLFNGRLLADGTPEEIMRSEQVQSAYLGGLYDDAS